MTKLFEVDQPANQFPVTMQPFCGQMKRCPKCGEIKFIELFGKDKKRKDEHNVYCKVCVTLLSKKSYLKTLEKSRERKKSYNFRNKEMLSVYGAEWHQQNKECRNRQISNNRKSKKEYYREYGKRWQNENPEKIKAYCRKYYVTHRQKRLEEAAKRKAQRLNATIGEVNYQLIVKRDNRMCHICGEKIPRHQLHFDHIIPLSKGGSHSQDNIGCTHKKCNLKKGAKLDVKSLLPIQKGAKYEIQTSI